MVRRGDGNHVEVLVLERLADVLKTLRRVAALLTNFLAARLEQAPVGIDQCVTWTFLQSKVLIDVGIALPVNAGDADANHVIGAQHATGRLGAGNGEERKRGAGGRLRFRKLRRVIFMPGHVMNHGCTGRASSFPRSRAVRSIALAWRLPGSS